MNVKRFDHETFEATLHSGDYEIQSRMFEHPHGDWVSFEDYERLDDLLLQVRADACGGNLDQGLREEIDQALDGSSTSIRNVEGK